LTTGGKSVHFPHGGMSVKRIAFVASIVVLVATGCQKSSQPAQDLVTPVSPPSNQAPSSSQATTGQANGTSQISQALALPAVPPAETPTTKEGWISLGNDQMDAAHYQDAIFAYQRALELDPKNVDVRVDMGTCYRNLGQPEKAIEIYKQALQINPRHPNAWRNSGVVYYYDLHENAKALAAFRKYLEVWPDAPDAQQIRTTIAQLSAAK